ncbi:MAG: UDP-N-acetylmuramoyl-tripeptide--D-alanyl-D-alanine ligase [Actinomycetes bacterium]
MIPLSLGAVAAAVGGTLAHAPDPDLTVTGPVVVDSREVCTGALFVAVAGERVDGHDYAAAAVDAGAVGVLAARPVGVPAVVVEDVVAALGRLARHVVDDVDEVTVVGVTGSTGKTTTKDLLAQVLARRGPTVAPAGSFNNEIGLPLTVLRADRDTRHLVLEMGARGRGHIADLCAVAPPRIGLVLNVGTAHVGEFGSREGVAAAKGELVEALATDGVAVLNGDDPLVSAMVSRTSARVVRFGESPTCDVRAGDVALDGHGHARFTLHTPEGAAPVALRLVGAHQVANALAAAAVARACGLGADEIAEALGEATTRSPWRMEVTERHDGLVVVNDAYNANPESMAAALKALRSLAQGRRTWAVLGEMRELGDTADAEHDALGRLVVRLDVARLVAVGAGAARIHTGARLEGSFGEESVYVPDVESAVALLRAQVGPSDVVLVKASRAVGLERVAEALLAGDGTGRTPGEGARGAAGVRP